MKNLYDHSEINYPTHLDLPISSIYFNVIFKKGFQHADRVLNAYGSDYTPNYRDFKL